MTTVMLKYVMSKKERILQDLKVLREKQKQYPITVMDIAKKYNVSTTYIYKLESQKN